MIKLEFVYILMGIVLLGVAAVNAFDATNPRRYSNAAFWALYGTSFLIGSRLPDFVNGVLVLLLVAIGSTRKFGGGAVVDESAEREISAKKFRNRLFIPVLVIPFGTLFGVKVLNTATIGGLLLMDPKQITIISLGVATLLAFVVGLVMFRPPISVPLNGSRRLMDSVGWAAALPQSLAALGAVFAAAGVGQVVAKLAGAYLPLGTPLAAVIAFAIGMALFTVIMGNAFAAFPVMMGGIGLPLVVQKFGGEVAAVAAIGMLAGFCGTLMTPMAANFNIVPAALLELKDRYAVIKAQIPTALLLLTVNIALMYFLAFRN
ncbi:MAG: DUF979 domain-containing protein [Gemmatimonadaceae bacterium]